MNKIPCNEPTMVTAIGKPAKYFSGIAMPRRIIKEIPSAIPVFLNQLSVLFIRTSSYLRLLK
jgi:hypothetical protein